MSLAAGGYWRLAGPAHLRWRRVRARDGGCLAQEPGGEAGGGAAGRRARARGARQEGREADQAARSARDAKRNVRSQAPPCMQTPVGRSGAAGGAGARCCAMRACASRCMPGRVQ